ncbi:DUF1850 domain-containing protein [Rossellomorea yichunensis]|uniref:DUF1850 domain-containing protein n=1 Tax=Rossellomorea yichunensis TaxID=3077331 RepID=UPI0028DE919E|nr:DUF1850 domain-containing protein [Rossellomorea sp. YC4-1]MDT9023635.1 DUF1850 domain-containing protein [Rossellomorea sp. YC4-1]
MKKISFIGTILIILVLLFIIFIPFQTYLVIEPRSTEGDPVLFRLPENHTFSVRYTHSIHLSEVEEFYRQSTNQIQQTKLLYEDTAIGMPANAEGNETFERTEEGKYLISNMNKVFPYIDIRIGQVVANHRLILGDKVYPLAGYFDKGSVVRMHLKKQTLYDQWKGVTVVGKR